MTIESINDKIPTAPAITYSECYVQPFFSFYNADNMAIMKTFKDKEFDLAIVDPPYGIGEANGKNANRNKGFGTGNKKSKKITLSKDYGKKDWDNEKPSKEYFLELKRISKNQIIFGANHFIDNIQNANSSCWIVWDKDNGESDFADCELAWTSFKTAVRMKKVRWNGLLQYDMKNKEERIHPTQKPIMLYDWVVSKYAKPNDKILDTHLGSGSIAIAIDKANTLDKKNLTFVGIELDPDYFRAAVERFKNHKRQCVLF